jgi:uncharacterized tellurite resistance protein B-like protein
LIAGQEKFELELDKLSQTWYNTLMRNRNEKGNTVDIFEATARHIMKQYDITTRKALVSAMRELGYARFAADRTADKIFGVGLTS